MVVQEGLQELLHLEMGLQAEECCKHNPRLKTHFDSWKRIIVRLWCLTLLRRNKMFHGLHASRLQMRCYEVLERGELI